MNLNSLILGFGAPGPLELAIIAGIILLLFGGSKLPSSSAPGGRCRVRSTDAPPRSVVPR